MADVSKIKVPNGTVYNLKDETARAGLAGKADASHTHTEYALKSKYGDTTINVGRKADTTVGGYSTAEGDNTTAIGYGSHAEGELTTTSGHSAHAEGSGTTANGTSSHAEGSSVYTVTNAIPDFSNTTSDEDIINVWNKKPFNLANKVASHSEGRNNLALGIASHAEGYKTIARGENSHTGGYGTRALHLNEVAYGKYNESNDDTLFSIGDGTADSARHNAFEITTTGGKLYDKNIVTDDMSLPANGGNADTLDGHHADYFAKYDNPSIEGSISLVRAGNATTADSIFAWEDTLRLRNQDPNAENTTYTDLLLTPSGIFTEGMSNGNYISRKEISTTPIKKISFPSVAIYEGGGGGILFSIDHGTPIAIACTSRRATQCTQFVADNTWYVLAKDAATLDPIPSGSYSFDVWYI